MWNREVFVSPCRALAFAAFAWVLLSTSTAASADSPAGAQPRSPSVEAAIGQARALVEAGQPERALNLLRGLPREGAFRLSVLFQTGIAAVAASGKADVSEDRRGATSSANDGSFTNVDGSITNFREALPAFERVR